MKAISAGMFLLVTLTLLGCTDDSAPMVSPNDQAVGPVSPADLAKPTVNVVHSVTASAHMFSWDAEAVPGHTPQKEYIHVQCKEGVDGMFSGRLHVKALNGDYEFEGDVLSFKILENKAKIESKLTSGPWAGFYFFVVFIESAQGPGRKAPDMSTCGWIVPPEGPWQYFMSLDPQQHIDFLVSLYPDPLPVLPLVPVDAGTVTIR